VQKGNIVEWISVDDELPEDDLLKVVRYKETHYGKHLGIALSRYYYPSNNPGRKYWCFEFGSSQPTKVTHWMPLPPPPKE
jgi:hypothetical protein